MVLSLFYNSVDYLSSFFLVKVKNSGSVEDLITLTSNNQERQTKIKDRLRKFFHRRPTMESLVKKGIWKGIYL